MKNCDVFTNTNGYLGHVIHVKKTVIFSYKTAAFEKMKTLSNITKLRFFLGDCDVFELFLPNFASLAVPLNLKLIRGQQKEVLILTAR